MLFKTSNPPRKALAFTLDKTRYIALVTISDDPAGLVRLPNNALEHEQDGGTH